MALTTDWEMKIWKYSFDIEVIIKPNMCKNDPMTMGTRGPK
jgi:hypothetical protein